MAIVDRGIADAKVEAISADLRFIAAFGAALTAATIALRASGFRTKTQTGHHLKTVECLEFTIGADAKLISKMRTFSNKRNATAYDAAGNVSRQELDLVIKPDAGALKATTLGKVATTDTSHRLPPCNIGR